MNSVATFLVGVAIFVGILGIVIPVLPGAILSLAAILVWSLEEQSATGWIVLAAAVVLIGASQVVKYIVPERRLRESGVPRRSMFVGVVLGIVGFFVIPVVGHVRRLPARRLPVRAAAPRHARRRPGPRRNTRSGRPACPS